MLKTIDRLSVRIRRNEANSAHQNEEKQKFCIINQKHKKITQIFITSAYEANFQQM